MIITGEMIISGFVSKAVNDGVDILKNKVREADKNRKANEQNIETRIYQVTIDAINVFTDNTYEEQDILYDAAECILTELKTGKDNIGAVRAGLKILDLQVMSDTCEDFLEALCCENCKNENVESKETYDKEQHGESYIENRAEKYAQKWDKNVFLNDFKKRDRKKGKNIKLREIYLEEHLPYYVWKEDDEALDDLKDLLKEYIVDNNEKKMLLILGQLGIGKSTLITWIMANLVENEEQILVYQFASDLSKVNWQSDNILDNIFKIIGYSYRELEGKTLILDGFDEIHINGDSERSLHKLN